MNITVVRVKHDGQEERIAISGGFLEVRPSGVTILAETAELASDIDVSRAEAALARAQARIDEHDGNLARAERAIKRAINRLEVASWK